MIGSALFFNATSAIHSASFIGIFRNNGFKYMITIAKMMKF